MSSIDYKEIEAYKALSVEARRDLLHILSVFGPLSLDDLSRRVGLKAITVRHHIKMLEYAGLIESFEVGRKIPGRPKRYYRVTNKYIPLGFPKRQYALLAEHLLAKIIQELGEAVAVSIIRHIGEEIGKNLMVNLSAQHQIKQWNVDKFCKYIIPELEILGSSPTIVKASSKKIVFELHNCIFFELARTYPDIVCKGHEAFFKTIADSLGNFKSKIETCMAKGEKTCRMVISKG